MFKIKSPARNSKGFATPEGGTMKPLCTEPHTPSLIDRIKNIIYFLIKKHLSLHKTLTT